MTSPAPIVDEDSGVTYEPWTNGWSVGYKTVSPTGDVEYVYLNPSSGGEAELGTVFAYQGPAGDPCEDEALVHFVVHDTRSSA